MVQTSEELSLNSTVPFMSVWKDSIRGLHHALLFGWANDPVLAAKGQ